MAHEAGGQAKDVWRAILGDLQLQIPRPVYDTWLRDTNGISLTESLLAVAVPTPFAIEWLERRMYQKIQRTVHRVAGRPLDIQFRIETPAADPWDAGSGAPEGQRPPRPSYLSPLQRPNEKYTFRNFIDGPSNLLCSGAASAVAEAPGQCYNPLFIHSGVGLGKTHLLHAIAHECYSRELNFIYVTGEQFTNEFIGAIRGKTTDDFRARYRRAEVFLIDDIQFICGKEQTQESFFHTFNELHSSNRQVVLTSDRPPRALPLLEDRLRSRFEWGLIADIQPPDLGTRIAILRIKAQQMGIALEENVIEFVARRVKSNVRQLEGTLNGIAALSRLRHEPVTMELAGDAAADYITDPSAPPFDAERVADEVCGRFRVTRADLAGPSRKRGVVQARHVAMYLLHIDVGMRDTDIGRLLGDRDHSTVKSAVNKVNLQIRVDPKLQQHVLAIKEAIFD